MRLLTPLLILFCGCRLLHPFQPDPNLLRSHHHPEEPAWESRTNLHRVGPILMAVDFDENFYIEGSTHFKLILASADKLEHHVVLGHNATIVSGPKSSNPVSWRTPFLMGPLKVGPAGVTELGFVWIPKETVSGEGTLTLELSIEVDGGGSRTVTLDVTRWIGGYR